jgi:hypothetical protein
LTAASRDFVADALRVAGALREPARAPAALDRFDGLRVFAGVALALAAGVVLDGAEPFRLAADPLRLDAAAVPLRLDAPPFAVDVVVRSAIVSSVRTMPTAHARTWAAAEQLSHRKMV